MRSSQSTQSNVSSSTKVKLPMEEANKADFPPGVKVLCFDKNGVRVGVVKNVLVSISVQSQRTFGTFYEIEMNDFDGNSHGIFVAENLRLTPGSEVIVDKNYFGSVFGETNGNGRGTILGSFETPPTHCERCARDERIGCNRNFFYSVRVKFQGMDEAVEAHGVPPENIRAISLYNTSSDASTILSEGMESIRVGETIVDVPFSRDEYKENSYMSAGNTNQCRMTRRIKPEDPPPFEDSLDNNESTQPFHTMYNHESNSKTFHNVLSDGDRQIYDSETASSSFDDRRESLSDPYVRGRSRSNLNSPARRRSTSRTRTYVKQQPAQLTRSVRPNALPPSPAHMNITDKSTDSEDSLQQIDDRASTTIGLYHDEEVDQITYEDETGGLGNNSYEVEEEAAIYCPPESKPRIISQQQNLSTHQNPSEQVRSNEMQIIEKTEEGCYLLFDESSGGKMTIQYSRNAVHGAIGFWAPGRGKKLQGFKFSQNQGRSDLLKDIAGKDYKKKYFSGVCQFIKAARMQTGFYCKWSDHERIENDVYVFYNDTCEIKQIVDGELFDVGDIDAVAVVPKGNSTFIGVRTGEFGAFIGRGDAAGASLSIFN